MSKHNSTTTHINDYGTDDEGVRRVYVNRCDMQIEVEGGTRPLGLTLRHFPAQRRTVDLSANLSVLPKTAGFDDATLVAKALIEGRAAMSWNQEAA